jgi:hypothetical protein
MSKRRITPAVAPVGAVFAMIAEAPVTEASDPSVLLDGLLDDLNVPEGGVQEAPEVFEAQTQSADGHTDEVLEQIEESADAIAARQAVYAAQGEVDLDALFGGQPEADKPVTEEGEVVEGAQPTGKKARVKLSAEEKAARAKARDEERAKKKAERDAAKAAQPPKEPRPTSVSHKPGDLLVAKLGSKWREFVVFDDADAADTLVLEKSQDEFVERMNDPKAIADKVREKAIMLFTWLKNGGELNEVMRRAFTVLHDQGQLTSGDKGNLQQNLLTKPYSLGTARSQANQMFMLFPELRLTVKHKGGMVPNANSVLLPLIYDRLGLTGAATDEGAPAPVVEEPTGEVVNEEVAQAE